MTGETKDDRRETNASVEPGSARLSPLAPRLSLIVAMSRNRVIGANGAIPWHLPAELKLFKTLTMGHHMIMGRKTYESIGRLLPGRTTVIVTRQRDYRVPGAVVAHTLEEAIAACGTDEEIFVIGGAEIFQETLPLAGRIYLTTVDADIAGDTYMPAFDTAEWRERSARFSPADERNPYAYTAAVHERG
jgi:dihydrofolate reductase